MKLKELLHLALIVMFFTEVHAQQQNADIKVLHRVRNDSILLRWAPTTPVAWQIGNKFGYKIKRYELSLENDSITTTMVLLGEHIKPLPLSDWESLAKSNTYAAIAAQAIYGESFVIDNPADNSVGFYNQASEQQNRFGFSLYAADMSVDVAQAMGLMLADASFDKNKKYVYTVELQENPTDYKIGSGANMVDPSIIRKLSRPMDPQIEFGDGKVKLSWNIYYDNGIYIAYIIERSDDGGQNFHTRNKIPFTVMNKGRKMEDRIHFLDSLEQNYKIYFYRIKGVTSFGETGPPSITLKGAGLGSARGMVASFDTAFVQDDGTAYLRWNYPERIKQNLLGYKIGRNTKAKGNFEEISDLLPPDKLDFIDKAPLSVNYYVVKAIGRDSVTTTSFPTLVQPLDSIPPSVPQKLSGRIDSTGYVFIDWMPSPEVDVAGYRVYRANSLKEEFMQITSAPVLLSEFRDEILLETLTEEIYYRVVATDNRDNLSDYSATLQLKRPDIIPPVPPVFESFSTDEKGIYLGWINSISEDVTAYELQRFDEENNVSKIPLQEGQTQYHDTNIIAGTTYKYELQAKDDDGLYSNEAIIHVQAFSSGVKPAVGSIKARADKTNKEIRLSWKYEYANVVRFLIYRGKGDEPMRFYKAVTDTKFSDTSLQINNIYQYQVKAIFTNDDESALSEEVRVVY